MIGPGKSVFGLLLLGSIVGCGNTALPANQSVAMNLVELEARFTRISPKTSEAEIAKFLGKPGAAVAGYSTRVEKKIPAEDVNPAAIDSDKYWASEDWTAAIEVLFDRAGRAIQIKLLRLTPMGPVSKK